MLLALLRDRNYDNQKEFALGVLDLWMAPTTMDQDKNLKDLASSGTSKECKEC